MSGDQISEENNSKGASTVQAKTKTKQKRGKKSMKKQHQQKTQRWTISKKTRQIVCINFKICLCFNYFEVIFLFCLLFIFLVSKFWLFKYQTANTVNIVFIVFLLNHRSVADIEDLNDIMYAKLRTLNIT